ncbi:MAG: YjhX family toxin [Pseudomonadota bacterium]
MQLQIMVLCKTPTHKPVPAKGHRARMTSRLLARHAERPFVASSSNRETQLDISQNEQRVLHELALGGTLDQERYENGKIREIICCTRDGHILTDCTLPAFLRVKKQRFIRSQSVRSYRALKLGIDAVPAQLNQR